MSGRALALKKWCDRSCPPATWAVTGSPRLAFWPTHDPSLIAGNYRDGRLCNPQRSRSVQGSRSGPRKRSQSQSDSSPPQFPPAPPPRRRFRPQRAKERPRLEANITTQLQLGRASRVMSLGGMAVGNGMQTPGLGSSTNPPNARIPPSKAVWAVPECCRASVSTAGPDIPQPAEIARHTHAQSQRPRVGLPAGDISSSDCKWLTSAFATERQPVQVPSPSNYHVSS